MTQSIQQIAINSSGQEHFLKLINSNLVNRAECEEANLIIHTPVAYFN
jgi:hypothetical protein